MSSGKVTDTVYKGGSRPFIQSVKWPRQPQGSNWKASGFCRPCKNKHKQIRPQTLACHAQIPVDAGDIPPDKLWLF